MKVHSPILVGLVTLLCVIVSIECRYDVKRIVQNLVGGAIRDYTTTENLDLPNFFSLKFPERKLSREYDFIVVGSGPAGCVIANRLSEDGKYSVLILEAGGSESPVTSDLPISSPNLQSTTFNWGYSTTEQDRACLGMGNSSCHWPHGKVLGGSSVLYYMIYTRGNRRDFDNWARAGNPGWSWNDVLPYFKKSENATLQFADPYIHGTDGPLNVEDVPHRSPISYAHVQAAREAGYKYVDYNSGDQIGVSFLQQSTRRGRRITAARAFLYPARLRKNLHIATHSTVKKVIVETGAYGQKQSVKGVVVKQRKNAQDVIVRARKEVILSAGAFESSKLLILSGVGPAKQLAQLDIPLVKDLPVGETLYEHMGVMGPVFTASNVNDGLVNLEQVLSVKNFAEYLQGRGPLTMNGVESLTYIKTNVSGDFDPGFPDVEIMQAFASLSFDTGGGMAAGLRLREDLVERLFKPLENTRAFFYLPMLLHPRSKGYMRLQSKNYLDYPIFEPNFFKDPRDLETLVAGMEEAIRLASQPSMRKLGLKIYTPQLPTCPFVAPGSHGYWRCWASTISATFHHQVGTCKMGPEEDSSTVVDHTLRVHGFSNLRVADIGIIPQPPSGHTNAYSYMIGEKASDMIKETWDQPQPSYEDYGGNYYYSPTSYSDSDSHNYVDYSNHFVGQPQHQSYSYPPKYFEFIRKKRSTAGFDWQKSSREEMVAQERQKVQVDMGSDKTRAEKVEKPVEQVEVIRSVPLKGVNETVMPSSTGPKLSDLLSVLRPSEVDILHKSSVHTTEQEHAMTPDTKPPPSDVAPLLYAVTEEHEKSGLSEVLESIPTVDEDKIKTVNLDNGTQFDKGRNKPQIVTEVLSSDAVNTTEFEAKSFPADGSTKAVHLPVLDGKLEEVEKKKRN